MEKVKILVCFMTLSWAFSSFGWEMPNNRVWEGIENKTNTWDHTCNELRGMVKQHGLLAVKTQLRTGIKKLILASSYRQCASLRLSAEHSSIIATVIASNRYCGITFVCTKHQGEDRR